MANGAVVTPFGNAGTRTARVDANAVALGAGELLVYTVTVSGAVATFGFSCQHRDVLSATTLDGGQAQAQYQWEYTPDAAEDVVVLMLAFVGAIKYTVRIDRLTAAGALLATVRDVDYESQDPTDTFPDNLSIFVL